MDRDDWDEVTLDDDDALDDLDDQEGRDRPRDGDDAALYRPNPARIYDYALRGSANFAPDRFAFETMVDLYPDAAEAPRANRAFVRRVVTFLAAQGIDRFLDVGSGLPTAGNVHEIAQRLIPQARVVYVDNDPVAVGYSQDLLRQEKPPHVAAIEGDLRDPEALLARAAVRRLLRPGRPVALLLTAVLPFVPDDDEAFRAVRTLAPALPQGSYLALSHGTNDGVPPSTLAQFTRLYDQTTSPLRFRPLPTIARFFAGFELVEPGLVYVPAWRPDSRHAPFADEPARAAIVGGVGRKP